MLHALSLLLGSTFQKSIVYVEVLEQDCLINLFPSANMVLDWQWTFFVISNEKIQASATIVGTYLFLLQCKSASTKIERF